MDQRLQKLCGRQFPGPHQRQHLKDLELDQIGTILRRLHPEFAVVELCCFELVWEQGSVVPEEGCYESEGGALARTEFALLFTRKGKNVAVFARVSQYCIP
jgi:hypothetical protein